MACPPGEGMFLACSFWLVDAYHLVGRAADARALFERLLGLCNDVGLLSEEYDPAHKRLVGNFPQAFSHIALVNTAHNLTHREKPSEHRGNKKALSSEKEAMTKARELTSAMTVTSPASPAGPGERPQPRARFPIALEGQPALVTGANSGIGRAVALGLAASGADVIGSSYIVDPAAAEEVAHEIETIGRRHLHESKRTSASGRCPVDVHKAMSNSKRCTS